MTMTITTHHPWWRGRPGRGRGRGSGSMAVVIGPAYLVGDSEAAVSWEMVAEGRRTLLSAANVCSAMPRLRHQEAESPQLRMCMLAVLMLVLAVLTVYSQMYCRIVGIVSSGSVVVVVGQRSMRISVSVVTMMRGRDRQTHVGM